MEELTLCPSVCPGVTLFLLFTDSHESKRPTTGNNSNTIYTLGQINMSNLPPLKKKTSEQYELSVGCISELVYGSTLVLI